MAMSEEIPQWAIEKADVLSRNEHTASVFVGVTTQAFARYIAQHEQPPVDPDVIAVREILAEGSPSATLDGQYRHGERDHAPEFQAALTAFRKHKEAGK